MPNLTTEQLAQRLHDCSLVDVKDIETVFGDLGTRDISVDDFTSMLLRRELVTNWQLERIVAGHIAGYFYSQYKLLYLVGAGTFARVYRAVDTDSGAVRALKVLRNRYGDDMATTGRFLKEARMVMALRHPNIVPIFEVESERSRYYMVMEFIEGQNLRDFVRVHKRVPLAKALTIAKDIAKGLDYAFERGVTHRDMKLSNVLLATNGRACLTDFGLAAADEEVNDTNVDGISNPRSIDYAGLERATNVQRDDKRSDIFFLGCMLYHMIGGEPALFETRERMQRLSLQRYKDIKPITMIDPDLPHRVVILLNRLLDLRADERIQTPAQAVREIESVLRALDAGDTNAYDARLAAREAEDHRKRVAKASEGESYTVMVIDSSVKIQDTLRKGLKRLGYKVLIYSDARRAMKRFEDHQFGGNDVGTLAHCVIFGCAESDYEGLDAFNHFGQTEETKGVPSILLTNERQAHLADEAKLSESRVHVRMPIKFRELREQLKRLVRIPQTETPPTV